MQIIVEQLGIRVIRDDGAELAFALSNAGLTTVVDRLVLEADEGQSLTVTVPFEAPETPDA